MSSISLSRSQKRAARLAGVSEARMRKGDIEVHSEGALTRARQLAPIDRYQRDGKIEARHADAARMLYRDYAEAGLIGRMTSAYAEAIRSSASMMPGCGSRYVEYEQAIAALMPLEAAVVRLVVLEEQDVTVLASGGRRKTYFALLRDGLSALVDHYRLAQCPVAQ